MTVPVPIVTKPLMIFNLFLFCSLISSSFASKTAEQYDEFGLTKLHNAILEDKVADIKQLIETKDGKSMINLPDLASKSTPLHLLVEKVAVQKGSDQSQTIKFIETLVNKKGADRTIQTDSEWTALNKAVYLASDLPDYPVKVIEVLLKDCVAVDKVTNKQTVLHFAAGSRLKPDRATVLVNLLLKHCANKLDYDAQDVNGWTALKVAIAADNNQVVAALKPNTSSISFVTKIVLAGIAVTIVLVALGIFFYFKMTKKPEIVIPEEVKASEEFSPSEISSEIDSSIFGSKEKIN